MAIKTSHKAYTDELQRREQALRAEIEQQSNALEKKVKVGFIVGFFVLLISAVLYFFFRKPAKVVRKKQKTSIGSKVFRWFIEYLSVGFLKQFGSRWLEKIKGS